MSRYYIPKQRTRVKKYEVNLCRRRVRTMRLGRSNPLRCGKDLQGYAARGELVPFVLRVYKLGIQGYAARGKSLPFVPFCAIGTYLLLATQIPQAVCEHPISSTNESSFPWVRYKTKNTTRGGVFSFMVHLNRLVNKK